MTYHCAACGFKLTAPDELAGSWTICPGCGQDSQVPDPSHRDRLRELHVVQQTRGLNADELREVAGHYRALGNLDKAETYYEKSLQIQPRQPVAANNLACRMLLKGGKPQEALTLAKAAHQAMPDSPNTADTLAWVYYSKGTYGFARDLLEDAVKEDPNKADIHYHLGMVYAKQHDKANALLHLKKAMAIDPNSKDGKDAKAAIATL